MRRRFSFPRRSSSTAESINVWLASETEKADSPVTDQSPSRGRSFSPLLRLSPLDGRPERRVVTPPPGTSGMETALIILDGWGLGGGAGDGEDGETVDPSGRRRGTRRGRGGRHADVRHRDRARRERSTRRPRPARGASGGPDGKLRGRPPEHRRGTGRQAGVHPDLRRARGGSLSDNDAIAGALDHAASTGGGSTSWGSSPTAASTRTSSTCSR